MRILTYVAVLAGLAISSSAWSASVQSVTGQVLVNRGDGFRPVMGKTQLKVGDAIMVRPGGSARLVYADDCPVTITAGEVVTITKESPCTAFAQAAPPPPGQQQDDTVYAVGVGIGAPIAVGLGIYFAIQNRGGPPGPGGSVSISP